MTDSDISANGKNGGKKYGMLSATFTAFKGKNPNVEMRETFNQTTPPTIVNKAEEEYDVKNLHYASFKEGIDSKAKISVVIRNIESDRATHIRNTNLRNKLDKGQKYSERYHIPISVSMECLDPFDAKLAESCSTSVTEVQWKMKYYFDMNEGICKSYWNDGCKSTSKNTFEQNECEWKCLGKHPTPKFKSWCGGTKNNFKSLLACSSTCKDFSPPNDKKCAYLPDWGPCNQLRYMWYFNMSSNSCEQFLYGNCGGNTNRFSTFETCQLTCEVPGEGKSRLHVKYDKDGKKVCH
uniref:Kunitz/Bovine pancreatic trypsin inhibitor domain protein n=1 Tax=Rhabditophanes sp. KR3021 TaxID=114890 RepID=A0AC35UBJ5_9BILA